VHGGGRLGYLRTPVDPVGIRNVIPGCSKLLPKVGGGQEWEPKSFWNRDGMIF
jgi:hypothetical protein